jgi:hypothetical protein
MSAYLDQLHRDMVMTAVAFGMPEPQARALAATLIDRIQAKHAGDAVYIPGIINTAATSTSGGYSTALIMISSVRSSGSVRRRCIGWWDNTKAARIKGRLATNH